MNYRVQTDAVVALGGVNHDRFAETSAGGRRLPHKVVLEVGNPTIERVLVAGRIVHIERVLVAGRIVHIAEQGCHQT